MRNVIHKHDGKSWIRTLWNRGELTREIVGDAIAEDSYEVTEEEMRGELFEHHSAMGWGDPDQDSETNETLINDYVESDLEYYLTEQAYRLDIVDALQAVYDNWTDDVDDEDLFELVWLAHRAIRDFVRAVC
jgi:hypothetical protein